MAQAQDHPGAVLLIADVDFTGNELYADDLLREQVQTRPNRRFLGIPGLTWWLWLHEWGSSGAFGERIGGALRAGGESPAFFDPRILQTDLQRLQRFYAGMGFREADVSVSVDTFAGSQKAEIVFHIERGTPTGLASVRYSFERPVDAALQERVIRQSGLRPRGTVSTAREGFKPENVRFTEAKLQEERQRIFSLLRRHGYAAVTPDSIRAILTPAIIHAAADAPVSAPTPASAATASRNLDRAAADIYNVEFQIDPGPRYHFGQVQVVVNGPESDGTTAAPDLVTLRGGDMRVQLRGETVLDPDMLDRVVRVRTGAWYDERALTATKRVLEAIGVFTYTNIVVSPGEAAENQDVSQGGTPRVPVRIELHTRQRHQLGANTFVQQERGAILTAGDNQIGTGVSVSYENVDLFGGGENLRLETTGAVAFGAQADPLSSSRAEISAALTLPYLPGPAGRWGSAVGQYDAKTRLSLGLLTARNERLRLLIRGRGRARFQFELQHSRSVTSWLDVMDLTLSSPDTLRGFQEQFLERVIGDENDLYVSDPVQRAQIISDYTHPQINDAVRYSLRLEDAGAAGSAAGSRGYRHELSVEAGGYVSSLLDRTVYTAGEAEGTLPGLPFLGADSSGNARMRYRPYVRAHLDLRRYDPLSSSTILAVRAMGGLTLATGYSDLVPFDRRFYSGGATSVRGWRLRELGPGGVQLDDAAASGNNLTSLLGGNVKLEASLELRQRLAREVLKADWWGVMFADAGNVWFGPRSPGFRGYEPAEDGTPDDGSPTGHFQFDSFYRQLGVGAGIGLRADWRFLVARFDLAYRLYDPAAPGEGFFPDNYERPVLHFGIGHTF